MNALRSARLAILGLALHLSASAAEQAPEAGARPGVLVGSDEWPDGSVLEMRCVEGRGVMFITSPTGATIWSLVPWVEVCILAGEPT